MSTGKLHCLTVIADHEDVSLCILGFWRESILALGNVFSFISLYVQFLFRKSTMLLISLVLCIHSVCLYQQASCQVLAWPLSFV